MANVRDSDTSLWLHNKLGTSNDSWISGSICSQLNKEVLRNVKDCFPDLQTQVKLKLLLSFFHIPRRLVEEWKNELEEIIEVAAIDSELWVSMVAEMIKTFPASGSLNTEISDFEETRPIFTDMVTDLRKMVSKHSDLGMLPLECQYLNKNALISVVGQQPNQIKHFTLKRKPKSATLRTELLQKSADAQSSLKKASAPTIPLRSRGMPRKMTDTTPLKGIPSRVPTSGFRSPTASQNQNRPNMSRTPAGRKDGGIKLIEFTDQPLGYAAAKKRKRQQEIEENQKRALEAKQQISTATPTSTTQTVTTSSTPDYAAGLNVSSVYMQPQTPAPINSKEEIVSKLTVTSIQNSSISSSSSSLKSPTTIISSSLNNVDLKNEKIELKEENLDLDNNVDETPADGQILNVLNSAATSANIISNSSDVRKTETKLNVAPVTINNTTPVILSTASHKTNLVATTQANQISTVKTIPISQLPKSSMSGPVIISQTIIQPAKQSRNNNTSVTDCSIVSSPSLISTITKPISQVKSSSTNQPPQLLITSTSSSPMSSLASFTESKAPHTLIQTGTQQQPGQPTKILLKTAPTIPVMMSNVSRTTTVQSNPPPLVSTQQPTILNLQNVNLPNRPVTIQPASQAAQVQHIQAQLQQQQQQQLQQPVQQQQQTQLNTVVSSANSPTSSKYAQVVMSPGVNMKGKTFILPQRGIILRSVGGDIYQKIPLGNGSGLSNLGGTTIVTGGRSGLVKTSTAQNQSVKATTQAIPALIPTNNLTQNVNVPSLTPVVIASHNTPQSQQSQSVQTIIGNSSQQTIIRPVLTTNAQSGIASLPQGLTLIQRPGQQPQLVQVQTSQQTTPQPLQRTIITQPPNQIRPQQIIIQHKPQTIITTQQLQQPQTQSHVQPQVQQRKGLSLSNEEVSKAHEMFRKANRVTRLDKALILAFMSGYRENPRPNPENVIVIKLGETEEKIKQDDDTYASMVVESLIQLDYNTGEWKTYQKCRRLDQSSQSQQSQDTKINQSQNSVVI